MSSPRQPVRVVSLFAGAGGLDSGLKRAGLEIVWANDFDPDSCATYAHNIGPHIHCGDVADVDVTQIPDADLVVGGFPCQGFSMANLGRQPNDSRNKLYKHFLIKL
jgi:DNA (cytosine-5)-methyltransferase 1